MLSGKGMLSGKRYVRYVEKGMLSGKRYVKCGKRYVKWEKKVC